MTEPFTLSLRPLVEIDQSYHIEAGDNAILESSEDGYTSLSQACKEAIGDNAIIEWIDNEAGYSPLERKVADLVIRGTSSIKHFQQAINPKQVTSFPVRPPEMRAFPLILSTLDTCYFRYAQPPIHNGSLGQHIDRLAKALSTDHHAVGKDFLDGRHPFTEPYINAIIHTIRMGRDIAINNSDIPTTGWEPLDVVTRNYLLNSAQILYLQDADRTVLDKHLSVEPLMQEKDLLHAGLYGPLGFYTQGSNLDKNIPSYISPVNTFSPHYGAAMAHYAFDVYTKMLAEGTIGHNEHFTIYEHGSGDGQLALDLLTYAKKKSADNPAWKLFYTHLKYISVEIAPPAVELQQKRLEGFDGFSAIEGDVLTWKPEHKGKGMVISVYLIDSFPPHLITSINNELYTVAVIPTVTFTTKVLKDAFLGILYNNPVDRQAFLDRSLMLKKQYLHRKENQLNTLYMTNRDFKRFESAVSNLLNSDEDADKKSGEFILQHMQFQRVLTRAETIKDVATFLDNHPLFESNVHEHPDKDNYVNTDFDRYIETIATSYFTNGLFMTVDTGSRMLEIMARKGFIHARLPMTLQMAPLIMSADTMLTDFFGQIVYYFTPHPVLTLDTLNTNSNNTAQILPHRELINAYEGNFAEDVFKHVRSQYPNEAITLNEIKRSIEMAFSDSGGSGKSTIIYTAPFKSSPISSPKTSD
jgi:hypothetical protein